MALSVFQTDALAQYLKPGMAVASLGYPDMIAPLPMIEQMLGERFPELKYRADSEEICARHGFSRPRDIPDAESFFGLMGASLTVFDVVAERGCEVLIDLNYPMAKDVLFDVVLDVGTLEHCFNVAQAIRNMAGMVAVGGVVIHENPFNVGNHGFYNLNPTFFHDYYRDNGFEVIDCKLTTRDGKAAEVPAGKRFVATGQEMNIFTVARRLADREFRFPVQFKYRKLINDRGVPNA